MAEQRQTDTQNQPAEAPVRKGYQPTGTRVDLSQVKPPRQGTAAQKPGTPDKEPE
jgi:hypothetical protein